MNLTRAQKIRLGTFMLSGTALLVGSVLVLAGLKIWEQRDTYSVRFSDDVGGLEVSAPVKYQGLRIGRVEDMYIAADDPTTIEVILTVDPRTVLHQGTTAVLDSSGLTGLKTINLTPGDPTKPRIEPGSRLDAGQSLVDRLTGRAEEIAIKVEFVANQLVHWTGKENRVRMEQFIESATALSAELNMFLETNREPMRDALSAVAGLSGEGDRSLKIVRQEVQMTLEETRSTLKAVRRPLEGLDPGEVARTVASTRRAMNSIEARLSSEEIGLVISGLVKALDDLTRLLQAVDLSVRAGREDFVSTLANLRQAAEDVREFSRIIAQDPSTLIRGKN